MDAILLKENGEWIKFSDLSLTVQDFRVSSIELEEYSNEIQGRPGKLDKGSDYRVRTISIPFILKAQDALDFPFKRDEIFYWLGGKEPVYLIEGRRNEKENEYIFGKRYYVRRTSAFDFDQTLKLGTSTIEYATVELPFGESTATTQTPFVIGETTNLLQNNVWSLGYSKIFEETLSYTFASPTTLRVYNGGTEPVNPNHMYLVITYKGTSNNLTIKNNTNGREWKYTGTSGSNDTIKIDGIESSKNGVSIVRDWNGDLIHLEEGWNDITVTGATSGILSFDFRYYFR